MTTIKAIETRYKGYRFRSRLEARWAVFFDALNGDGRWEYEKEGFDLGNLGWYLPDFYIHHGLWVEIKPRFMSGEIRLKTIDQCSMLAFRLRQYVILVEGNPWPDEYNIYFFEKDGSYPALIGSNYCFSQSGFLAEKRNACIDDELMNAFRAARSARFEHGENGFSHKVR